MAKYAVYTYGTRISNGREVDVFTAKPKKKGAKKVEYVFRSKWKTVFDDLWEYWEGKRLRLIV